MSFRLVVSAELAVLALFAVGLLMLPACDGTGGATLIRSGVFENIPLLPELEDGGLTGGGGGAVDEQPDEDEDEQQDGTGEGELPITGTMTVTFTNNASMDAQIALWSSEDLFASTALVQQNANLRPLGPEEGSDFLPTLRPGQSIQATLNCIDARSISAAVAEALVLFNQDACISPPLRLRTDFQCGEEQQDTDLIILIRDGRADRLELLVESRVFASCIR